MVIIILSWIAKNPDRHVLRMKAGEQAAAFVQKAALNAKMKIPCRNVWKANGLTLNALAAYLYAKSQKPKHPVSQNAAKEKLFARATL